METKNIIQEKVLSSLQSFIGQIGGEVTVETPIVDIVGTQEEDYQWVEAILSTDGIWLPEGELKLCQTVQDIIDRAELS